jgi:hypothetical protein
MKTSLKITANWELSFFLGLPRTWAIFLKINSMGNPNVP